MNPRRTVIFCAVIALGTFAFAACGGEAAVGGGGSGGAGGSGGGGTVLASSFDESCATASDCTPVFQGMVGCCGGACDNAAINKTDLAKYEAAYEADRPTDCTGVACPAIACAPPPVGCVHGKCAILPMTFDAGGEGGHGGGPVTCGTATCSSGEVCVMDQFEGGAVHPPNDAGQCPDGDVKMGPSCEPKPTYHCAKEPSACGGTLSCACAQPLCESGYTCMSAKDGEVGCYLLAP